MRLAAPETHAHRIHHAELSHARADLAARSADRQAILPMIFMEGCNARCAFCAYSMTKMVKRDAAEAQRVAAPLHYNLPETVQALARRLYPDDSPRTPQTRS